MKNISYKTIKEWHYITILFSATIILYLLLGKAEPIVDDYYIEHKLKLPGKLTPLLAYTFIYKGLDINALKENGQIPWWSEPGISVNFFRPFASLYLFLMWKFKSFYLLYITGIILFSLSVIILFKILLLKRLSLILSAASSFIFMVLTSHCITVTWPAAVNDLLGLLLVLLGFYFLEKYLIQPNPVFLLLLLLSFLCSGMSKETYLASPIWLIARLYLMELPQKATEYKKKITIYMLSLLTMNSLYFLFYLKIGFGTNCAYYIPFYEIALYLRHGLPSLLDGIAALFAINFSLRTSSILPNYIFGVLLLSLLFYLLKLRRFLFMIILFLPVAIILPRDMSMRLLSAPLAVLFIYLTPEIFNLIKSARLIKIACIIIVILNLFSTYMQAYLRDRYLESIGSLIKEIEKTPSDSIVLVAGNPFPGIHFTIDIVYTKKTGKLAPKIFVLHPSFGEVKVKYNEKQLVLEGSSHSPISYIFRLPQNKDLFKGETSVFKAYEEIEGKVIINIKENVDINKVYLLRFDGRNYSTERLLNQ
ncbi:MAG: hypothetical protein JXA60_12270 [Candidatus Coatesbacteria bacterium]|nr:hypothetical protein [Candidatus Coatesbacteria bacterium]